MVHLFSLSSRDFSKELLGGKGANLAEMSSLGLPVPPGFTISVKGFHCFYKNNEKLTSSFKKEILENLNKVEKKVKKVFGDKDNPLLVSVRSGACVSMPGMMDTILNLGLNDETVQGLACQSEDPRFAWDSYRRFLQMYSNVVMGMNFSFLEVILEDVKEEKGCKEDTDLNVDDLKLIVEKFKKRIFHHTQKTFPTHPEEQLWEAISAVFRSWYTPRAVTYRKLYNIDENWGTAVNVQAMVFGNLGSQSATGVCFTRNPSTGKKEIFGEFLPKAQGEDVVAGIRTPFPITSQTEKNTFKKLFFDSYSELLKTCDLLENHYKDMQDIEFTVEKGRFWLLQTRSAKRAAKASVKIACDLLDEKKISEREALMRIDPLSLNQLLHPLLDPHSQKDLFSKGLPASPGGVTGKIIFDSSKAVEEAKKGENVILVRKETSPEDIEGMIQSKGVLTIRGGMTSHAAVVARGMGKCCVVGCHDLELVFSTKELLSRDRVLKEGDVITLDGSTGEVFVGELPTIEPCLDEDFQRIMKLSEKYSQIEVRVNADTKKDVERALGFGAKGVGLCRTEHMFFSKDKILLVRKMILAQDEKTRQEALKNLFSMQKKDFKEIFLALEGRSVNVRLLDPPLHEFLPQKKEEIEVLAEQLSWKTERLRSQIKNLHEFNPMLGHRGCRLGLTFPSVYEMQALAMAESCAELIKENQKVNLEIMLPLVMLKEELQELKQLVKETFKGVEKKYQVTISYQIGTMIELPRACFVADELAKEAEFFSFGTNDLTQTCLGLSRDDCGKFLPTYVMKGFFSEDPFVSLDIKGVGELMSIGIKKARKINPSIKIGVCGEHGGDPQSISFFHRIGLNYVSCSPYRIPIAKLALAKAQIQTKLKKM